MTRQMFMLAAAVLVTVKVRHKTGPGGPVKTIVIRGPGAEARKIAARWTREP
jgi:hypothetical protein